MSFREQQMEHTPGSLLTLDEAAQRIGVATQTVRDMIRNNQIPGHRMQGEWRVDVAQVDLWTSTEKRIAAALGSGEEASDTKTAR